MRKPSKFKIFFYIFKTSKEYEKYKNRILLFYLNEWNGKTGNIVERKVATNNLDAKFPFIDTDETLLYIGHHFLNTHRGNKMNPHPILF